MDATLHPDVAAIIRKFRVVGVFGYVVGGWMVVGGVAVPELVPDARVPGWVLALVGSCLLLAGWLAASYGPRWYRRASWVAMTVAPTVMQVRVQAARAGRDDSRTLRALLTPEGEGAGAPPESVPVQWPDWDAETLPEGPAEVFRDPRPGGPIVIKTARGWLWPAPGAGSRRR